MRVLTIGNMYPPHHLGGYELAWRGVVEHLRSRGDRVRVLTTDFRLAGTGAELDTDVHRKLRWYWDDHGYPPLSVPARLTLERDNAAVLRQHLDELRPEVVLWSAMGGMSLSLIEAVRRRGLPAAGIVLDDWMLYAPEVDGWMRLNERSLVPSGLAGRLAGVPGRVDLDRAAAWAFISETTRRRALERRALARTSVINAGIDAALFEPAPEREWAGRLLYAGRVDERKGIATAIRALDELPGATLRVDGAGDGRELARLRGIADAHGVASRVEFGRSPRAELPRVYAEADAVLFPVLWEEPWGLVPLEAMATGTPVVATGLGGSGEYLRDGTNCLLFEPADDHRALAAAVGRLAADEPLRRRLREGGFETAARFDEQLFCSGVAALLDAALALAA